MDCDNEGRFTCYKSRSTPGWICTREYDHSGPCNAEPERSSGIVGLAIAVFGALCFSVVAGLLCGYFLK